MEEDANKCTVGNMNSAADLVDMDYAIDLLVRLLAIDSVTGEEAAIAAAVSDELRKVGVPEGAIRHDTVHTRIPLPTEVGNLLVDLPGYGYAKVSKEERKSWGVLAEAYLNTRKNLSMILLLVDIRHDPTDDDILMMDYIRQSNRRFAVVATKSDKVSRAEYKKCIDNIKRRLDLDEDSRVIPFSAPKRMGVDEIWSVMESFLE